MTTCYLFRTVPQNSDFCINIFSDDSMSYKKIESISRTNIQSTKQTSNLKLLESSLAFVRDSIVYIKEILSEVSLRKEFIHMCTYMYVYL